MLGELGVVVQRARVVVVIRDIVVELRNPEIEDLGEVGVLVLFDENHVLGFDVAVNDSRAMGVVERTQDMTADVQSALPVEALLPFEQVGKQDAVQQLEHHVKGAVRELAEVGDFDAVRVVDATDGKRLPLEALGDLVDFADLGVQELERQGPLNRNVLRKVDAPHPAGAEHPGNPVARIQDLADPRYLRIRGGRERGHPTPPFGSAHRYSIAKNQGSCLHHWAKTLTRRKGSERLQSGWMGASRHAR